MHFIPIPSSAFRQRIHDIPWKVIAIITLIAGIGILMLYSAANGNFSPWANKQLMRFCLGFTGMMIVALIDIRVWLQKAYLIYGLALVLLVLVELAGFVGMGAQRWIDLYFIQLQPSEVMKISLVLVLARYFHDINVEELNKPLTLLPPLVMILVPMALVLRQPDLGTAMILLMLGASLFFIAGVSAYYFIGAGVLAAGSIPVLWHFLHQYQRDRVLNFLNPEHDPLNTGYQILQSKIALGSGGLWGKGFLKGSQSHLNFLPAKQTDFIFTMLCEEFGMIGGVGLIILYFLLIYYGLSVVLRSKNRFGRLVAVGMIMTLFLYMFINISMVMGLAPVVGVPLPLITYGGTSMLTLLISFGFIFAVDLHRERRHRAF